MNKRINWFGDTDIVFKKILKDFIGKNDLNFLEIGSFVGDSALWMLENILTGDNCKISCVDPWEGKINFNNVVIDFTEAEKSFDERLSKYGNKVLKYKNFSDDFLTSNQDKKFDFIYIDGDHVPHQVMLDALLSWKILKVGGVMGFDDYGWSIDDPMAPESYKWDSHAGPAIDLFLRMYSKNITILEKSNKVFIRKDSEYTRIHDASANPQNVINNVLDMLVLLKDNIKDVQF